MKTFLYCVLSVFLFGVTLNGQTQPQQQTTANSSKAESSTSKRPPVFRATKGQISEAQNALKQKGFYAGEATGKLDDVTRAALKKFQESEKIRANGTLNRITLEKLNIALTDAQKAIPVIDNSKTPETTASSSAKREYFRAVKDQIMQAQKMLKDKGLYAGEQSGKMSDDFRGAIRKFQEAEKINVTGTLNRETIEKMGIPLTDKQRESAMAASASK